MVIRIFIFLIIVSACSKGGQKTNVKITTTKINQNLEIEASASMILYAKNENLGIIQSRYLTSTENSLHLTLDNGPGWKFELIKVTPTFTQCAQSIAYDLIGTNIDISLNLSESNCESQDWKIALCDTSMGTEINEACLFLGSGISYSAKAGYPTVQKKSGIIFDDEAFGPGIGTCLPLTKTSVGPYFSQTLKIPKFKIPIEFEIYPTADCTGTKLKHFRSNNGRWTPPASVISDEDPFIALPSFLHPESFLFLGLTDPLNPIINFSVDATLTSDTSTTIDLSTHAFGGVPPLSFTRISGAGTVSALGNYASSPSDGIDIIEVKDAVNRTLSIVITVSDGGGSGATSSGTTSSGTTSSGTTSSGTTSSGTSSTGGTSGGGNSAPYDIFINGANSTSISENLPTSTVVGTLSASDPDSGDSFTYSIQNGNTGNSFSISGILLYTNANIDYETNTNFSLTVRVTDSGGMFYEKAITINISNEVWEKKSELITDSDSYDVVTNSAGQFAFMAEGIGGLKVVDLTSTPFVAATYTQLGYDCRGIARFHPFVYLACGSAGLVIINIQTPHAPQLIGTYNTPGTAYDVVISGDGNTAYVADGTSGLQLINITIPSAPTLISNFNTPGDAKSVQISGSVAYIADSNGGGLRIVSISNPSTLTEIGYYNPSYPCNSLDVFGSYAYVACGAYGVKIINIGTPGSNMSQSFQISIPIQAYDVKVSGNYLFVADGSYGMKIYNISTLGSITQVNTFDTNGIAKNIFLESSIAYIADGPMGLQQVDISTLTSLGSMTSMVLSSQTVGIGRSGNYLYHLGTTGLRIYNATDINNPSTVTTQVISGGTSLSVSQDLSKLYITLFNYFKIYDISSTPANPVFLGGYSLPSGTTNHAQVVGNYAFIADGANGMVILDISNPASIGPPVFILDTLGTAYHVEVVGNYAYIADGANGLVVADVSNLNSPAIVGTYNTSGIAQHLRVNGNYVYLADGVSGLAVFDVSAPAAPILSGAFNSPGEANKVEIDPGANKAYLADYQNGLVHLNVTNPNNPSLIETYDTPGMAKFIKLDGGNLFLGDHGNKLFIFGQ